MIQPGLSRIAKLLAQTSLPWRAIHVAGTNGKGSICNYTSSMLDVYSTSRLPELTGHGSISWAKFTSPHLIDEWDGITINKETIQESIFDAIRTRVSQLNVAENIGASEFEILTATAFEAFTQAKVEVGIVEVGMGGKLDATNILGQKLQVGDNAVRAMPLVTAISKIGLDHQMFLGNSLAAIAEHKAGIMKPDVPVVYDESNEDEVKRVFDACASTAKVQPMFFRDLPELARNANWAMLPSLENPYHETASTSSIHPHIRQNLSVALRSTWIALSQLGRLRRPATVSEPEFDRAIHDMVQEMSSVSDPSVTPNFGRLEKVKFSLSADSHRASLNLLLDGAHNAQSAAALSDEVVRIRQGLVEANGNDRLCWIVAISNNRKADDLLKPLLKPGDIVFATEFGSVVGMPWVKPVSAEVIAESAARFINSDSGNVEVYHDVETALVHALAQSSNSWAIAAGSLYLVSDIHRLLQKDRARLAHAVTALRSADPD